MKLEGASHKDIEIRLYVFECEIQKRFRRYVGDVNQKWGSGRKMEIIRNTLLNDEEKWYKI